MNSVNFVLYASTIKVISLPVLLLKFLKSNNREDHILNFRSVYSKTCSGLDLGLVENMYHTNLLG